MERREKQSQQQNLLVGHDRNRRDVRAGGEKQGADQRCAGAREILRQVIEGFRREPTDSRHHQPYGESARGEPREKPDEELQQWQLVGKQNLIAVNQAKHAVAAEDDGELEDEPEPERHGGEGDQERVAHGDWAILPK
jgi:hypothetical protein